MTAPASPSVRSIRAMAAVRWLLLLVVAGVAGATWWTLVLDADAPTAGEPRYYCPMHPQIRSHDPGTCPICFMTLEPIPDERTHAAATEGLPSTAEPSAEDGAADAPELPAGSTPTGTAAVMLTTERRQASGIAVATVERRELGAEVRWPATVEALEGARAEVRVRAEAFVERVVVGESGVRVRRGQILAWVYSPEILRAEEELLAARRWLRPPGETGDADEAGEMGDARDTDATSIDDAATRRLELLGVTHAEAESVARSSEARRRVPLRAPISGTVTRFGAALGTYASPETVLYEITDYERVRVVATVLAPSEVALAASGHATLRTRAGDRNIALTFEIVEPVLDASSRGARARFLAESADGALRPGDIGEVVVLAPPSAALFVPRDAVIDRGRARYVFVETSEGLFEPRVVTLGALRGEEREIVAGLSAGERVVVRGGFVLDSESRLAAALAPRAAPDAGASTPATEPATEEAE